MGPEGRPEVSPRSVAHGSALPLRVDIRDAVLKLREARGKRKQSDVAAKMGVSRSALSMYEIWPENPEAGREPDIDILRRWAAALDYHLVFELRSAAVMSAADGAAHLIENMEIARAREVALFVEMAATAKPQQLRSAMAAFRGVVNAATEDEEEPLAGSTPART